MLRETLNTYTARLTKAKVDSPRLSAEVLLAQALGLSRQELLKELLLRPESSLAPDAASRAEAFIVRRERGEPVAYITGIKEFYGRDFRVTPDTLIPRPDTETLVDAALAFAAAHTSYAANTAPDLTFMDLGTGSGAIAVTLALELPSWQGIGVDVSSAALAVAKQNAEILGAANARFLRLDFRSPEVPAGPFDMIVSNPPYVSEVEYAALSPEVKGFEPKLALVPETPQATGLECLTTLMDKSFPLLKKNGLLLLEMGSGQGDALLRHVQASGYAWADARILPDMAGLPRVFRALRS